MRYRFMGMLSAFLLPLLLAAAEEGTDTVLGFNVLVGFNYASKLAETAAYIRGKDPEVVLFQEIARQDSAGLARLGRQWGHPYAAVAKPFTNYSIGMTSRRPFDMVETRTVGLHHGYVLARIDGVYFMSIHLSPFDWQVRYGEAGEYLQRIRPLLAAGRKLIMMGDFNALSPLDKEYFEARYEALSEAEKQKRLKNKSFREGRYDYSVIGRLLDSGLVDSGYGYMKEHGISYFWRIDLALLSPAIMADLVESYVDYPHRQELLPLSDHRPNILTFRPLGLRPAPALPPTIPLTPPAAVPNAVNHVQNGDFEQGLAGWKAEIRTPDKGEVKAADGRACLTRTKGSTFGRLYQDISTLEGGKYYTLTFRQSVGSGALIQSLLIFQGADRVWREKTRLSYIPAWAPDEPFYGNFTFQTPADFTQVRLDFRLDSVAGFELDDVVLRAATPAEVAALTPRELRPETTVLLRRAVTPGELVDVAVPVPPRDTAREITVVFTDAAGALIPNSRVTFHVSPSAQPQMAVETLVMPPGACELRVCDMD